MFVLSPPKFVGGKANKGVPMKWKRWSTSSSGACLSFS